MDCFTPEILDPVQPFILFHGSQPYYLIKQLLDKSPHRCNEVYSLQLDKKHSYKQY